MNVNGCFHLLLIQAVQVAAVVLVVGLVSRTALRHRPHLAYALWLVALAKCLVPPVLGSPSGVFSWIGVERQSPNLIAAVSAPRHETHLPDFNSKSDPLDANPSKTSVAAPRKIDPHPVAAVTATPAENPVDWRAVAVTVWAAVGAIGLVAGTILVAATHRRIRGDSTPASAALFELADAIRRQLGIRRRVPVCVSRKGIGPAVIGTFRPTIILPLQLISDRSASSRADLRMVLWHEMSHVRRGDAIVAAIQRIVVAVWWFHPLAWWMSGQLTAVREQCCDEETVAGLGVDPPSYAQTLLDVAGRRRSGVSTLLGVHAMQVTTHRLKHLVTEPVLFHKRSPRRAWIIAGLAAALLLPGAGLVFGPRVSADQPVVAAADWPTLLGEVTDKKTGKPVVGATVHLYWEYLPGDPKITGDFAPEKLNVTSTFTTDHDGRYQVVIPAEVGDRPRLRATVMVQCPGYGRSAGDNVGMTGLARKQRNDAAKPVYSTSMDPCDQLTGIVVGPDNKRVAGARVVVECRPQTPDLIWDETTTDVDGQFKVDVLRQPGCHNLLSVYPEKLASLQQDVSGRWDAGVIRVAKGTPVAGSVLDTDGKPLGGIPVVVQPLGDNFQARTATTDAQGHFQVQPLAPGQYEFGLAVRDSSVQFLPVPVTVPAAGAVSPVEFRPAARAQIVIHTVDETGKPVTAQQCFLAADFNGTHLFRNSRKVADDVVAFDVPVGAQAVRVGLNSLSVVDPGTVGRYRRGDGPELFSDMIGIGTVTGDVDDVTVIRVPKAALSVTVNPPDGMALKNVWVRPHYTGSMGDIKPGDAPELHQCSIFVSNSGAPNLFLADHIQPDEPFTLTVTADGCAPAVQELKLDRRETRVVTVTLKAAPETRPAE